MLPRPLAENLRPPADTMLPKPTRSQRACSQALQPPAASAVGRSCWLAAVVLSTALGCVESKAPPSADAPGEWRRWRGPNGQGVSQETALPIRWTDAGESFRWKTWLPGAANSSPIASGGRIFLTTAYGESDDNWAATWERDKLHRAVLGLDLETGELLWQTSVLHGVRGRVHHSNTRAAPSPATDGRTVFVSFDGILAALDFEGNLRWMVEVDADYYEDAHYGASISPIVTADAVVLMQDRETGDAPDAGWIAAYDKQTGEEIWRDEWTDTCCSYTTPVLRAPGEATEVLRSNTNVVVAHDAETGARLWQAEHQNSQPVPSLLVRDDLLSMPGAMHDRTLKMVRLSGAGTETLDEPLWATGTGVPKIPTPLIYRDRLFVLTDTGQFYAYDPESGEQLWRGRVATGAYRASLVAGDGKLYAVNQYGVVTVVDANGDQFRRLSKSSVGEVTHGATPAIAGGCLLVRTENHLICVEAPASPA